MAQRTNNPLKSFDQVADDIVLDLQELYSLAGGSSVKIYRALIEQPNLQAPVATVLENTLGATVSYTYDSEEVQYFINADSAVFTADKTFITINTYSSSITGGARRISDTQLTFDFWSSSINDSSFNSFGQKSFFEIIVYP